MATFNLRKFSEPDRLKTIKPSRLIEFLKPYNDYLDRRGFKFPGAPDDEIDYETLANILIHPDDSVPRQMVDALYFVHGMADAEQMAELLGSAKQLQLARRKALRVKRFTANRFVIVYEIPVRLLRQGLGAFSRGLFGVGLRIPRRAGYCTPDSTSRSGVQQY